MTSRPSIVAPILAVLAIVLAMLGAYVGGYFWLGSYSETPSIWAKEGIVIRTYPHEWQVKLFRPLAILESWLTGYRIEIGAPGKPGVERAKPYGGGLERKLPEPSTP